MHWEDYYGQWAMPVWGQEIMPFFGVILLAAAVWSLAWKGMALWRAAQLGSKKWFVVLLVVNTLGILEILYLYIFSKKSTPEQKI